MDLEKLIEQINVLRMLAEKLEPDFGEISICSNCKNTWNRVSDMFERRLPYGFTGD